MSVVGGGPRGRPEDVWDGPERRQGHRREVDRGRVVTSRGPIVLGLLILSGATALCAVGALVFALVSFGQDEGRRIIDLRASCRRASVRNAASVNLNWIYYLSEKELTGGPREAARFRRSLGALSSGERRFLLALTNSNPSRRILEVRARADFAAAKALAAGVQATDVDLVHLHTPLGLGAVPRSWVRRADFSCPRAYR